MQTGQVPPHTEARDRTVILPPRHVGRWVAAAVVLVFVAMIVNTLVTNERFQWSVVGEYFTAPAVLQGIAMTMYLTGIAMVIGLVLGVLLAIARMSDNPVLRLISSGYIWFFRGTPVLVQLILWFNLASLYPTIGFGIPFGPVFFEAETNKLIAPFVAGILGLGLHQAAYQAEIVRSGLMSVSRGEIEAAHSIGMTEWMALRRVILPQAIRIIIPPTGNQIIALLKFSSLASVIAVPELLYATQAIYQVNFKVIPLLLVASLWYLFVVTVMSIGQHYLERRYAKASGHVVRPMMGAATWRRVSSSIRSRRR